MRSNDNTNPLIIINLKTYERGSDVNAEMLVRELQKASTKYKAGIAIAAQAADLFRLTQDTTLPLFAQHVDPESYGAHYRSYTDRDCAMQRSGRDAAQPF